MSALLDTLAGYAERWVHSQRNRFRPGGEHLSEELQQRLGHQFAAATLERTRWARTASIDSPDVHRWLGSAVLDLSRMQAITLIDTVVISDRLVRGPPSIGLAFHELVHVVQYDVLGTSEFIRRYVRGWVNGGCRYAAIPFEVMAYRLQREFLAGRLEVDAETWIRDELARSDADTTQ